MNKRIVEREALETVEAVTDELNEINNMLRNMIADISSACLALNRARLGRESGEEND